MKIGEVNGNVNIPGAAGNNTYITLVIQSMPQLKEILDKYPNGSFRVSNRRSQVISKNGEDIESPKVKQSDKKVDIPKEKFMKFLESEQNDPEEEEISLNNSTLWSVKTLTNGKIDHYIDQENKIHMTMELSVTKSRFRIKILLLLLFFMALITVVALIQMYILSQHT